MVSIATTAFVMIGHRPHGVGGWIAFSANAFYVFLITVLLILAVLVAFIVIHGGN
jgi:hypothetical protein